MRSHADCGRSFEQRASDAIATGAMERPDIVLASLPPLESVAAAARLARRADATFIVDVMDLGSETFERLIPCPDLIRRSLARLLCGGMVRRRDAVLSGGNGPRQLRADRPRPSRPEGMRQAPGRLLVKPESLVAVPSKASDYAAAGLGAGQLAPPVNGPT